MRDIKFSIVVPTYNRAGFIGRTIKSLLAMDYSHFEIIVIDDGSTDNTDAVVSSINDQRVRYLRIANSERGVARNTGAREAMGEYVNFFDSDDLALTNHLSVALQVIEAHQQPELIHLAYRVDDTEGKTLRELSNMHGDINLRLVTHGNFFSCNGVFIRRDIAINHPFVEDRKLAGSEDAVLWMQLACHYTWRYSNTITSVIVEHDARSVVSMNKSKLLVRLELFVKHVTAYEPFKIKYSKYARNIRTEAYTYAALHLAMAGYTMDAIAYLIKMYTNDASLFFSKRNLACIKRIVYSMFLKKI